MKKAMLLALVLMLVCVSAFAKGRGEDPNMVISPNPVKTNTTITVYMPYTENVTITIENKEEATLHTIYSGRLTAGVHNFEWNRCLESGEELAPGRYVVNLTDRRFTSVKRIIILK